jgi:hypothetical protein
MVELTENELIDLEALVNNERSWNLLKKMFMGEIAEFWDRLRLTDPSDDARVSANHKLAVGVEASLGAIAREMEDAVMTRRYRESNSPVILGDMTETLYK